VVAEVGVHDDDIVSCCELQTVDVGGSEAEFAGAGAQLDVLRADGGDELFGDFLRAVGGAVVDDDDFPVEVSGREVVSGVVIGLGGGGKAYSALKVCSRSQTMMGRLRRSL
jgi:hypothetical protein